MSAVSGKFSQAGGRPSAAWGQSPGSWRSPATRVFHSRIAGWGPICPPLGSYDATKFVCICGPASAQKAQAMVSSVTVQESEAIVPKPEGGMSEQGPFYPPLNLGRQQYQLEWNLCQLMWVIPNESTTVGLRDVQRDLWPPVWLSVLIGAWSFWAQNYHVHHFFNTDALQQHGKQAHPSGSSDPI